MDTAGHGGLKAKDDRSHDLEPGLSAGSAPSCLLGGREREPPASG